MKKQILGNRKINLFIHNEFVVFLHQHKPKATVRNIDKEIDFIFKERISLRCLFSFVCGV